MSTYSIYYESNAIGTLEAVPDGLYTVFTARCEPVLQQLRLSVFGAARSAYLGLMLPEGDALYLRRRLTRLEVSRLPDPILYAAEEAFRPPESAWTPFPDGTLRRRIDGRQLVAVPAERVRAPGLPRRLLRRIVRRDYLVFPL